MLDEEHQDELVHAVLRAWKEHLRTQSNIWRETSDNMENIFADALKDAADHIKTSIGIQGIRFPE